MRYIFCLGLGVFLFVSRSTTLQAAELQVVHPSFPAPSGMSPSGLFPATNQLDLVIGLPLRDTNQLADLLRRLYDPSDPAYRHFVTPEEFTARFGPSEEDYQAVMDFARANGMTIVGTHPNRLIVDVRGSVPAIERAFHLRMLEYRHPTESRTFYAPDAVPAVALSVPILGVSGLNNYSLPRPRYVAKAITNLSKSLPHAGSGPGGTFAGGDFRSAYVPGWSLTGAGQTVGLLQFDGYNSNDIAYYESRAGLPSVPLVNVLLNGVSGRPSGGEVEVSLDIESSISMAPGLSKVIVYEGAQWHDILNRMATDNLAKQLSCSWYTPGGGPDPVADQIWQQMAAQGQSFYNASGDADAYTGPIDFPGDTPYITQVGGTTLTTSGPGGSWVSETVWNWGGGTGSGGGVSTAYPIPSWQTNVSMTANLGSTTMRNTPDVALTADNVYVRVDSQDDNVGGTSCAAPLWAGYTALINQLAVQSGEGTVGWINPTVYALGQRGDYLLNFHDIRTGNNQRSGSGTHFPAVPGYDLCTGWGTPTGSNLLYAIGVPEPLRIFPGTNLLFTGPVGGPFNAMSQAFSLTNNAGPALNWSVGFAPAWFRVIPSSGTLVTGGPPATVTVALSDVTTNMSPGNYPATIWFTNLSDGFVQTRALRLAIVTPPSITGQPTSQAVFEGATAIFNVVTSTNALMNYQWFWDNGSAVTNLVDRGDISGSSTSTLTVSNAAAGYQGAYFVVCSNAAGSATSMNAFLTIVPWRPIITQQPADQTVLPGASAQFSVSAVGTHPLSYRWRLNGTNLVDGPKVSGSGSATLALNNVTPPMAGAYSVVVSNVLGNAASSGAVLSVTSVAAPGMALNTIASFPGGNSGEFPYSSLAPGNDGNYYGTTLEGGSSGAGTTFRVTPNGVLTIFHSFTGGNDGAIVYAALTLARDGFLYGTTTQTGAKGDGTVFRMSTNGLFATTAAFNGLNGFYSVAGLIQGSDGNFYGTTLEGGAQEHGNVFRMTPSGVITNLHAFNNVTDGSAPSCVLVQGTDGMLYGTTESGGTNGGWGTVFKIAPWGTFTTLAQFNGLNGGVPVAGMIQDSDGNFYGTTYEGGTNYAGSIFRMSPDGAVTNLYSFTGGDDGENPFAGLALGLDGNFYGATANGGAYSAGTLYRLDRSGVVTTLAQFDVFQGANPQGTPLQGPDGAIYGTTQNGGANGLGAVYQLMLGGPLQITSQPKSQTVFLGATAYFSVATFGAMPATYHWLQSGTNLVDGGGVSGSSSRVLAITNAGVANTGVYSVIVSNAYGSVTSTPAFLQLAVEPPFITRQPEDQTALVGSTIALSVEAFGDLPLAYQWQRDGTNLVNGGIVSGANASTLLLSGVSVSESATYSVTVSDDFYWTTSMGAIVTIIPVTAPGYTLTSLRSFANGSDGGVLNGLALGKDGNLYGTAQSGGASGYGNVFRLGTNGTVSSLVAFSQANGASPHAGPFASSDGFLYGTTLQGGSSSAGSIFRASTTGSLLNLYSFGGGNDGLDPTASLVQGSDGALYGTTYEGGYYSDGTAFKITTNGSLTTLHAFAAGNDGYGPWAGLMQAADGNFYGTTEYGGASGGLGTVFRLTPSGTLTTLHTFRGGSEGSYPLAGLIQGPGGYLYGTTSEGGNRGGYGTVFRMTTNGVLATLYQFAGSDGSTPAAALVASGDGAFYGTAEEGGIGGYGTVFRITTNGVLTTLVWFEWDNGADPDAPLVLAGDGNFYGTTSYGGSSGYGTTFRLTGAQSPGIAVQPTNQTAFSGTDVSISIRATGSLPLTYQWQKNGTNLVDLGNVEGSMSNVLTLESVDLADAATYSVVVTNLYGSVASSNAVLSVVEALPVITLQPADQTRTQGATVAFTVAAVGSLPMTYQWQHNGASLDNGASVSGATTASMGISNVASGDAGLYSVVVSNIAGATVSTSAVLTVQLLTAPGVAVTTLRTFSGAGDGANPNGLIFGGDGRMYGTTIHGGSNSSGTAFSMTLDGVFSTLYVFGGGNDGGFPSAKLSAGGDGYLYGTTLFGGSHGYGTVFRISTNSAFNNMYSFSGGADGAFPYGWLLQAPDGSFYGTASYGGAGGNGSIFKIGTNAVLNTLYTFSSTGAADDGSPYSGLVLGEDGNFYGTAAGSTDNGGVFRISPNGAFTRLYAFSGGQDGGLPYAGLVRTPGGILYGTTSTGGTNGNGSVFDITTNGAFSTMHLFTGGVDGSTPDSAGLMLASDGYLYGTTAFGGYFGDGTVYRMSADGQLTTLVWFNGANGATPESELVQAPDGSLYGTTQFGGSNNLGTIFKITLPGLAPSTLLRGALQPDGTVILSWNAVPGWSYQVQWCAAASGGAWTNLGAVITPSGTSGTASDTTAPGVQRFYRLKILAPH